MTIKTLLGAAVACIALSNAASALVEYDCGTANGTAYNASLYDEENVVVARSFGHRGELSFDLHFTNNGSYIEAHGNTVFFEDRGQAYLNIDSVQMRCVVVAFQDPGGPLTAVGNGVGGGVATPRYGVSRGGDLYAGPGTQYGVVGDTFDGMEVQFAQDSGIYLDGFSWWLIEFSDGSQAYQWGGQLCAPGQPVTGMGTC